MRKVWITEIVGTVNGNNSAKSLKNCGIPSNGHNKPHNTIIG